MITFLRSDSEAVTSAGLLATVASRCPPARPEVASRYPDAAGAVRTPPMRLALAAVVLDAWISEQPEPRPSRPEAIRLAFRDWLTGLGYLPHREDPEMAN